MFLKRQPVLSKPYSNLNHRDFTLVFLLAFILFLLLACGYYLFRIQSVEVSNTQGQQLDIRGSEYFQKKNLILLNSQTIYSVLKAQNPDLLSVVSIKQYPQTLRLIIEKYQSVAYLTLSPTRYLLLASDGTLNGFAYDRPTNIGEIIYYQSLTTGDYTIGNKLGQIDIQFATKIAELAQLYGHSKFIINIMDAHLILCNLEDVSIISSSEANPEKQLIMIKQVMELIRNGSQKIKSVDVRFEKMIIENR